MVWNKYVGGANSLTSANGSKTISGGRPEAEVIVMLKMLVLQQLHIFFFRLWTWETTNCSIFFQKNFLFSWVYTRQHPFWSFRKRMIDNYKEEMLKQLQRQLNYLGLKIKREWFRMLLLSIQILDMQKQINLYKMKEKRRSRDEYWIKKSGESHFGYKLHSIIDRDYELIRRFKTTTASLMIWV